MNLSAWLELAFLSCVFERYDCAVRIFYVSIFHMPSESGAHRCTILITEILLFLFFSGGQTFSL